MSNSLWDPRLTWGLMVMVLVTLCAPAFADEPHKPEHKKVVAVFERLLANRQTSEKRYEIAQGTVVIRRIKAGYTVKFTGMPATDLLVYDLKTQLFVVVVMKTENIKDWEYHILDDEEADIQFRNLERLAATLPPAKKKVTVRVDE